MTAPKVLYTVTATNARGEKEHAGTFRARSAQEAAAQARQQYARNGQFAASFAFRAFEASA
jgi:hypothetical protein